MTAGWNAYASSRTEQGTIMANTKAAPKAAPKRKSKGKRHVLHAESLEHMARELDLNRSSGAYITAFELSRILRGEVKRVRSILR